MRILLNEPVASWPEGVFWLLALPAAAAGLGTGAVWLVAMVMGAGVALLPVFIGLAFTFLFIETILRGQGARQRAPTSRSYRRTWRRAWPTSRSPGATSSSAASSSRRPDNGVLHTKMVIADGQRATVLGSPYSQRYFDDPRHQIDNPERGDTTSDIVHDVSIGLVGPVVGDLHETFRAYWNEDQTPGDQIPSLPPDQVAKAQPSGTDGVVKVQVVRTLSAGRFSFLDGTSEKGILESYLRAFGQAKRFIYLENQYFTDAIIADALAKVLKDKPGLELIFLLNIKPDVMLYPGRQARLVKPDPRRGARTGSASSPAGPTTTPIRDRGSRRSTCTPRWRSSTTPGRPSARPTSTGSPSTTTSSSARSPSARPRPPS